MPWNKDGTRKSSVLYKMKGSPMQRNFGISPVKKASIPLDEVKVSGGEKNVRIDVTKEYSKKGNKNTRKHIAAGGEVFHNSNDNSLSLTSTKPKKPGPPKLENPHIHTTGAKKGQLKGEEPNNIPVTPKKKKVSYAEAYKKRDMKTYGNLNLKEYTTEAKRQTKHKKDTTVKATPDGSVKGKKGSWDAPKSQMKGSVKPADKTSKTPSTPKETKLPVTKDSKKTQSVKDARAKRKEARKAVRTARKTSGRGSDEVKAAKAARKTARKNVRTAKKNRRATRKQSKEFAKN